MAVMINISELKETLESTPSTQNIMLVGKHGIGKSEILTSYYNSKGMKVVTLFLGQMADPGDIIGLPSKVEKQDADGNVTLLTDFTPPYWFPQDGKPIVLFLDELNRARPEILQTVMDLTLNRKLAGKALPEGSYVISKTIPAGLMATAVTKKVIIKGSRKVLTAVLGRKYPTSCSK